MRTRELYSLIAKTRPARRAKGAQRRVVNMKEVKDISKVKQDEAEKDVSDYKEEEKQVVLDDMFAKLLDSWVRATSGSND